MSRVIKFRGKTLYGEWACGVPSYGQKEEIAEIETYINDCSEFVNIDPKTVGQFTGLCDKSGKEIYEGDIVHCKARSDAANMVVIFEEGAFKLVPCGYYALHTPGGGCYPIVCFAKEIIGNIYENPELLVWEATE